MRRKIVTGITSVIVVLFFATATLAGKSNLKVVDAGSFGIYIGGKRVATETFKVEQGPMFSVTHSEIRVEGSPVSQLSNMELASNGDLHRYAWESEPEKAELTIEPKDEFLVEHIVSARLSNNKEKSQGVPHLLPHSTVILDDNFFSQREILAWRYLAAGCQSENGAWKCNLTPMQYGVLIPNQHAASTVSMEYQGLKKVRVKGEEKQLGAFRLETESGDWILFLDENQKLVRISIPSENTEVVRD